MEKAVKRDETAGWRLEELSGDECVRLRGLWEEVFREDSRRFTDYYFSCKASGNRAFAIVGEDGGDRAMLHLTPCLVEIRTGGCFAEEESAYIVGVATREEFRHRGYMDSLLRAALRSLCERRQPFAFLMPASPAIYEPYDFAYIYDRDRWKLEEAALARGALAPAREEEFPELAAFAESELRGSKDVFLRRDEDYFRLQQKELRAQNGDLYVLRGGEEIAGYMMYAHEEKPFVQEAVAREDFDISRIWEIEGEKSPVIMGRVACLSGMLSLMRTAGGEAGLTMEVEDPVLPENAGVWRWRVDEESAGAERIWPGQAVLDRVSGQIAPGAGELRAAEYQGAAECRTDIRSLTAWLFGQVAAEDCFLPGQGRGEEEFLRTLDKLSRVRTLGKVWINEIV